MQRFYDMNESQLEAEHQEAGVRKDLMLLFLVAFGCLCLFMSVDVDLWSIHTRPF